MELTDPELQIIIKLLIATGLGMIPGIEREIARKPAGLRTHMLVAGAVLILAEMGNLILLRFESIHPQALIQADPLRILEAVVVGISFIGAGTIIKNPKTKDAENLSTAASLLIMTGIGLGVSMEYYWLAICLSLLTLVVNAGMEKLKVWLLKPAT